MSSMVRNYNPSINSEYGSSRVISSDSMSVEDRAENFDLRGYEVLPSLCEALQNYLVDEKVIDKKSRVFAYRQVSGVADVYETCSIEYVQVNVYYFDGSNRVQMHEMVGSLSELMGALM